MNDRELLEMAAKAIGATKYGGPDYCRPAGIVLLNGVPTHYEDNGEFGYEWNPLTDDGDALRMALRLSFAIGHNNKFDSARWVIVSPPFGGPVITEDCEDEAGRPAATRRAIVRAAAAIGAALTTN